MTTHARPSWVADAIFYQIFPDRFARSDQLVKPSHLRDWHLEPTVHAYQGGDLVGIVEHLDYLVDLGVTAIYLNPIFWAGANHRYHTYDYLRVDPLLGDDAAFDQLVAEIHDRNMRVVIDGVFNHSGRGFHPFHDVLENGSSSPYCEWFTVHSFPPNAYDHNRPPGYDAWWNLHALPKLNTDNREVRDYLMEVAEHWIERGADGWRLDVPEDITTVGFWEEFRIRVRAVNPDAYLVGEVWNPAEAWVNDGERFDGVMNYQLTEAILRFAAAGRIDASVVEPVNLTLAPALDAAGYGKAITTLLARYPYEAHLAQLNLLGSHDTPRVASMVSNDDASVTLAMLLMFTFPGAPCIYYGDEIGLTGRHDPLNRGTFPWDESKWDKDRRAMVQDLIRARRDSAALRRGAYRQVAATGQVYVFERLLRGEVVWVAVNAGDAPAHIEAPDGAMVFGRLDGGALAARSGVIIATS